MIIRLGTDSAVQTDFDPYGTYHRDAMQRMMKVYRSRVSKWMARRRKRINDDDEQQIQKKKMKTTTMQSKSIDHISISSLIADDEDLVSQILSWLPVKSLMRFKCVSKAWKFIIEKDAHFIHLHLTCSESRSPGFLIMAARPHRRLSDVERRGYDMCFFPADSHLNVHGIKRIQSSVTCLGPVRGLVCLVDRGAVQLFNVGTGEVTPWLMPEMVKHYSRLDLALPAPSRRPRFFFGFDPSSRKHKVLCMRGAFKPHGATSHYEVLTLGEEDSRWRIIDDEPPYQLSTDMVAYANGSIYSLVRTEWFESVGSYRVMKTGSEFLVAFDFGSEKFRKIPNPTFTRLEEEEVDTTECSKKEKVVRRRYKAANRFHRDQFPYHDGIIEMDWCLTLIRRRYRTVKIWKFHDSDKKENGTSSENEEWSLVKDIKLPDDITSDVFVYFHPVPGKCQLMLETYVSSTFHYGNMDCNDFEQQYFKRNTKFARFYLYNMTNDKFTRVRMTGLSSLPENCKLTCAPLVESLFPV